MAVGAGARGVGSLVDVLAVDVDGVADEGRAAVAVARVPLLEAEQLDLGLDLGDEARHLGCGSLFLESGFSVSGRYS